MEKSVKNEVTITPVTVKKEIISEDIKEFAETAMNELLGWYGYENPKEKSKMLRNNNNNCRSQSDSNSSGMDSPKLLPTEGCGWCGKSIEESSNCLTSAASSFCSELCFSQSRRASFKKNKTCDWCRHVRHTVSYVDFQDGASQLQFCSDKCLNQYKMHIFCRETTAHLELHPHLHGDETSSSTLITPELWLRNCKSPSDTENSSHHVPSGTASAQHNVPTSTSAQHHVPTATSAQHHVPTATAAQHHVPTSTSAQHHVPTSSSAQHRVPTSSSAQHHVQSGATSHQHHVTSTSPRPASSVSPMDGCAGAGGGRLQQTSPLPLVARQAKMISAELKRNRAKSHKKIRKRCPSTITSATLTAHNSHNNDSPQDLRIVRHSSTSPLDLANLQSQSEAKNDKNHSKNNFLNLRIDHHYTYPIIEDAKNPSSLFLRTSQQNESTRSTPRNFFDRSPSPPQKLNIFQRLFNNNNLPAPLPQSSNHVTPPPDPPQSCSTSIPQNTPETEQIKAILDKLLPPSTVFMPYPVILPLPIPIPIPIPIPKIFTVKEKSSELILERVDSSTQTELMETSTQIDTSNNTKTNGFEQVVTEDVEEEKSLDLSRIDVEEELEGCKKGEDQSRSDRVNKRYLRKRRKIVEPKNSSRVFLKNRKMFSN